MKDKIIINIISKIHFILLSIISFIFSILFVTFIVLQNGIYIDNISISNIKAKQLYIKWDEKISIIIEELNIDESSKEKNSKIDFKEIVNSINNIKLLECIIEKVLIKNIFINDISGSFEYSANSKSLLHLDSKSFSFVSSIVFEKNLLNMKIESLVDKKRNININGNIILDIKEAQLVSSLDINLDKKITINMNATSTSKELKYSLSSDSKIIDIKKIVDMIGSDLPAKFWYYDAIDMSYLTLDRAYGRLAYNKVDEAYKNLYVKATVNNLKYTYDELLAPIDTSHTVLVFKEGKLNIYPKNASTYNVKLDSSWLNIDFTKKQIPINLYLDFTAQLDDNLLYLLKRYDIDLPFKQTKGTLKTKLDLNINISTEEVMAKGEFFAKKGQIHYLGMDIDVFDALVVLNGKHVTVKNMLAKYKDKHIAASSYLDIDFNAANQKGKLDFRLRSAYLKDIDAKLSTKALHVEYIINPKQDYIIAHKSIWKVKNEQVTLAKVNMPFVLKTSSLKINNAPYSLKNISDGFISGSVFLKPFKIDLTMNLMSFKYNNVELASRNASIYVKYKNYFRAYSRDSIALNISNQKYKIDDFNINIKDNKLNLNNIGLHVDKFLDTKLSINYDIKKLNGYIDIHKIKINSDTFGEVYNDNNTSRLFINNKNNNFSIVSKKYDFIYANNNDKWSLNFNAISKFSKNSKLLKKYNLVYGQCNIFQKSDSNEVIIKIDTNYKYKLLVKQNEPVKDYTIYARYNTKNGTTKININNIVFVDIKDDIKITANNTGINFSELMQMLENQSDEDGSNLKKKLYFNMDNSYLYLSKDRHVISDSIEVRYVDKALIGKLKYKNGSIKLILKDDNLEIFGMELNDTFMNELFALSKFKGGHLNFYINGPKDAYDGTLHVNNSIIKDYKILNNVLAFVNTIPSLFTFKIPGYSKKGLKIENALLKFAFKDEVYNIEEIVMRSKEIDIVGKGKVSIIQNTIDIDLNLKTDIGSSLAKIPIVGYILLGKESVSTSLKIQGQLNNPKVKTQVSRDIITAPLNILKRTILLPMILFNNDDNNSTN